MCHVADGSLVCLITNHPITNHLATPNPQSPIPNPQLYACLHRLPHGDEGGTLAAIAREFSPRYQLHHPDLVVIDVAGLHRLLGPARTIGDELRKAVSTHGIRAHVAIASTQTAAIVLAHTRPGLTVIAPGDEATALAPTAIGILAKFEVGSLKSANTRKAGCFEPSGTWNEATSDFALQLSNVGACGRWANWRRCRTPNSSRDSGVLPSRGRCWRAASISVR